MSMKYDKLFALMKEKGLTTLQKLREGKNVTTDSISALCAALGCQPGDIMEYVEEENKDA